MGKVSKFLSGKKTKLVGLGSILLGIALGLGWIELEPEQMAGLLALLLGAGKLALRFAIDKVEAKARGIPAKALEIAKGSAEDVA